MLSSRITVHVGGFERCRYRRSASRHTDPNERQMQEVTFCGDYEVLTFFIHDLLAHKAEHACRQPHVIHYSKDRV